MTTLTATTAHPTDVRWTRWKNVWYRKKLLKIKNFFLHYFPLSSFRFYRVPIYVLSHYIVLRISSLILHTRQLNQNPWNGLIHEPWYLYAKTITSIPQEGWWEMSSNLPSLHMSLRLHNAHSILLGHNSTAIILMTFHSTQTNLGTGHRMFSKHANISFVFW